MLNGAFVLVLALAIMFAARVFQILDEWKQFRAWSLDDPEADNTAPEEERAA